MRRSETRYRTLFEAIDAGFCVVALRFDPEGRAEDYRFLEVNPAFARQTGIADAAGRWMREIAPDHEPHWFDLYGRVALTGEPIRFVQPARALGERWYEVHAFRVDAPEDRHVAILFNDITAQRRLEEALRGLNETLERQVAARTAERDRIWQVSRDMLGWPMPTGSGSASTRPGRRRSAGGPTRWWGGPPPGSNTRTTSTAPGPRSGASAPASRPCRSRTGSAPGRRLPHPVVAGGAVRGQPVLRRPRRHRAARSRPAPRPGRGGAAPVAEDGGGGATHRRRRPRLQQPAHDHPLVGGLPAPAELPEARKRRYLDAVSDTVDRAAKLTGQLLAFARRQALAPRCSTSSPASRVWPTCSTRSPARASAW